MIPELTDWTLVWDSDLIPFAAWPLLKDGVPASALLQHKSRESCDCGCLGTLDSRSFRGVSNRGSCGDFHSSPMWFTVQPFRVCAINYRAFLVGIGHLQSWIRWRPRELQQYWAVASWMAARYPGQSPIIVTACRRTTERFSRMGEVSWRVITENGRYSKRWPSRRVTLVCGPVCMRARCLSVDWRSAAIIFIIGVEPAPY